MDVPIFEDGENLPCVYFRTCVRGHRYTLQAQPGTHRRSAKLLRFDAASFSNRRVLGHLGIKAQPNHRPRYAS